MKLFLDVWYPTYSRFWSRSLGIHTCVYGDKLLKEPAVLTMNHLGDFDWICYFTASTLNDGFMLFL